MDWLEGLEHIVRADEPLAPYTWLRIGGAAQYFAEPTTLDELRLLVARCREAQLPVRVLGGGSNLLVRDEGVAGVVVSLAAPAFAHIVVDGELVRAGAGARLNHVVTSSIREGLGGLESFAGIPGTVGGAIATGVESHGTGLAQWTHAITAVQPDGSLQVMLRKEWEETHQRSLLDSAVISEVAFQLERGDCRQLTQRMQQAWIVRRTSLPPAGLCTARMFSHPTWTTASALIEQAGLRGTRVGNVELSDRDPNYLVAHPGATSREAIQLMELVQATVREKLGVELERALRVW
ncbi:MAG: UDP-N-acetylenolpyruvoylglucosamine reductase [Pirellulaceae bacterium]|nr:MAG: UDP-N-acetylenolpyruvoylglucosamine reductase [Pirellulaceae bacterium]